MIRRDFKTLAREVNGRLLNDGFATAVFEGVAIDSRVAGGEQLFIAIKGDNDDGHKYINDALKKNCAGLLVNENYSGIEKLADRAPTVTVKDTHQSMKTLAQTYRKESGAILIAVTGSNGKTTTKELIYSTIKSKTPNTYRSPGNYNNLYGLPLSILAMPSEAMYAVFELGISVKGEMTELVEIAVPDLVLISNVGPTHLETLGTVENVAEEKFKLVDFLPGDKPAIINGDDPIIMQTATRRKRKFITYGLKSKSDFTARLAGISKAGYPLVEIDGVGVEVRLFGEHQAYNILAAYAVGKTLGLNISPGDLNDIEYDLAGYRGQIETINGLMIIADCYNANPASMKSGLNSLRHYLDQSNIKGRPSTVIVGDMLELGDGAIEFHREVGRMLTELDFDYVIAVGELSKEIYDAACKAGFSKNKINNFADADSAGEFLMDNLARGGIIYLKGSRGIGLEKIITLLRGTAFRHN